MITADEIELYAAQISQLYFDKTRDAAKLIGHLDGVDADAVLDRAIDIALQSAAMRSDLDTATSRLARCLAIAWMVDRGYVVPFPSKE